MTLDKEAETEELQVQMQPRLHNKFKANLSNTEEALFQNRNGEGDAIKILGEALWEETMVMTGISTQINETLGGSSHAPIM